MSFEDINSASTLCDLSTNQTISKWYAFIVFLVSVIILVIILVKVIITFCKLSRNTLHISDITASSYDYHPVE
jgi:flagellar biosynthesis/type III secretory pathway M-ring protein FliF/YscJ